MAAQDLPVSESWSPVRLVRQPQVSHDQTAWLPVPTV